MDKYLFQLMVEKQNEWRRQYYANKRNKHIIKTVCNKKYKSKGNRNVSDIHQSLLELGFLDEVILTQTHSGELCYESIYGK
jgi:hypothetical protein